MHPSYFTDADVDDTHEFYAEIDPFVSWFSYDSSGFSIDANVGFGSIGVYTILVQITDDNSI